MNLYFVIGVPCLVIGILSSIAVLSANAKVWLWLTVPFFLGSFLFPYFDITRRPSGHDKCDLLINGMWIDAHQHTIVNDVDVRFPHSVCVTKVAP